AGQSELKGSEIFAAPADTEGAAATLKPDILNFKIHLRRSAVSNRPAANVRKNSLDIRIFHANDGGAIERNLVNELGKSSTNFVDRGVVIQMLPVDVRHNRDNRGQLQKRAVALVRLDNQELALADTRIRATHGADPAAHNHGRVETGRIENRRHYGSGGGLSMTSGDRDAEFQAHQFSQHFAAGDYGNLEPARLCHFRVVFVKR